MAWTPREKRAWRDLVAHLDTECPGGVAFSVVRRSAHGDDAHVHLMTDGSFRISIAPKLSIEHATDSLIHELAHVLADWKGGHRHEIDDHNDLWGCAYATIYRIFLTWENA